MWRHHLTKTMRSALSQHAQHAPMVYVGPQPTNLQHFCGYQCPQAPSRKVAHASARYLKESVQAAPVPLLPLGVRWCSAGTSASSAILSETTTLLRNLDNGAEIYLVGTAHVSRQSAEEVRELIRVVRPTTVMVELCQQRAARLQSAAQEGDIVKGLVQDLLRQLGGGSNLSQAIIQFGLQGFYRVLRALGMDPGQEFKVAMDEAKAQGARLVYSDADVQQTLSAISAAIKLQDIVKMVMGGSAGVPKDLQELFKHGEKRGLADQVEALKTRQSAKQMVDYMRSVNPEMAKALTDDRDEIMVKCLQQLEGRTVGVVGLAHLDGMQKRWDAWQQRPRQLRSEPR